MILTGTGIIDSRRQALAVAGNYVANNGTYYYSGDGLTWYAGSGPNFFSPTQIAWNGSYWLAGGLSNGANPNVLTKSTDGKIWTLQSPPFSGCTAVYAIIWDGTKWMAGTNAGIYTSTNGTTWTYANSAPVTISIAYSGSLYVAVGNTLGTVRYSSNGTSWTTVSAGTFNAQSISSVFWDGTNFWLGMQNNAAGQYASYRSNTGSTWFASTTANTVFQNSGFGGLKGGARSGGAKTLGFGLLNTSKNMVGQLSTAGSTTWSALVAYPGGFGANGFINQCFYDGTKFLALTKSSTLPLAYSYDGNTWYNTTGVSANTGLTFGGLAGKTNKTVQPQF
jgi:hypothetical protein